MPKYPECDKCGGDLTRCKCPFPSGTSAQADVEDRGESKLVGSGSLVGPLAKRYWKAPFRYDAEGQIITDANGERALDVRGWGYLTGRGAEGIDVVTAIRIQDDFGASVVRILNASWPNVPAQPRSP